jgi:hypothetical protein
MIDPMAERPTFPLAPRALLCRRSRSCSHSIYNVNLSERRASQFKKIRLNSKATYNRSKGNRQ